MNDRYILNALKIINPIANRIILEKQRLAIKMSNFQSESLNSLAMDLETTSKVIERQYDTIAKIHNLVNHFYDHKYDSIQSLALEIQTLINSLQVDHLSSNLNWMLTEQEQINLKYAIHNIINNYSSININNINFDNIKIEYDKQNPLKNFHRKLMIDNVKEKLSNTNYEKERVR